MKNGLIKNKVSPLTWTGLAIGLIVLLVLGQLQRIQVTPFVAIYVHDLLMLGIVGLGLTSLVKQLKSLEKHNLKHFWLEGALIVWVIGGLVLAYLNRQELTTSLLYAVRLVTYSLGVWFLVKHVDWKVLIKQWPGSDCWRLILVMSGCLMLALGFVQYLLLPDMRFLRLLGWDDHYYRLIGTQFDPGFTGILLVLAVINIATFNRIASWVRWVLLGLLVVGIALTFSRSTYLALLISLLALFLLKVWTNQVKAAIACVGLGLWLGVLLPFLPRPAGEGVRLARTSTVIARSTRTQEVIRAMSPRDWLVGRGLFMPIATGNPQAGEMPLPDHARLPDNLIILLITNLGVGGLGLIVGLVLKWSWRWRGYPTALILLLAVIAHSMFNNTLFQPFVWLYLWLTVGSIVSGESEVLQSKIHR